MTQQKTPGYPKTAMILAIVGGSLIIFCGLLLVAVGTFILPNLDFSSFPTVHTPPQILPANLPNLIGGIVRGIGAFGLVSGVIVLVSAILLNAAPTQRTTWGVLVLVFSVLSFLGLGGFAVGAILGIAGGILALRWKPAAQTGNGS